MTGFPENVVHDSIALANTNKEKADGMPILVAEEGL